jgi:putative oxidoreductase
MGNLERFAPLVGRILLAQIFLASGLNKLGAWEQTAGYMASKNMKLVPLFLVAAILFEVGGGLSVALGYKAKVGAATLFIFLIPATLIFHNFWTYQGIEQQVQMIMFMKNLAILGGLLLVIGMGAGPLSLDNRKKKEVKP